MKRNVELVRIILLEIEKKEEPLEWITPEINGYSENEISYHIKILAEAGFVEATELSTRGTFQWGAVNLTWNGHEFLDASRNETIWKKTKSIINNKLGSASIEVVKELLIKTASTQLGL